MTIDTRQFPSPDRREPTITITQLAPDDWQVLRGLKLKSLEQEPIAFEDVKQARLKYTDRTETEWRDILSGKMSGGRAGEVFTVFAQDSFTESYVGMVSAIISENSKTATVQHMYVDNEGYRGRGIGRQLLRELIDRITAKGIQKIELQVVVTQEAAVGLYTSLGFKEVKRSKNAVQRGDAHYDEYEMELIIEKVE
ncbi:MAG: GNAT family N-acetyltransferase [Patescibacteria group bacterium]